MSIRPVDMQVVIHKNQEVHHAKQTVVSKLDNELIHAQFKTKEDNLRSHHTVQNTERSDFRNVKNDEETTDERKKRKNKEQSADHEQSESNSINRERFDRERINHEKELNQKVSKAGARFDMKV